MKIVIRKMGLKDLKEVMVLLSKWNMAPIKPSSKEPSPERDFININNSFVALDGNKIIGISSYIVLSNTTAETASLAVDPEYKGQGIGYKLQRIRFDEMKKKGIRWVHTETDRQETINWYIKHFGYKITGTSKKKHAFSKTDVDYWTVLKLDLLKYDFNKLIINAAPTGIVPTKKTTPYVPITPEEIAIEAKKVYDLGVSIIHVHARDKNGAPTSKKEIYKEIIDRIRDICSDIIITVSTSGRGSKGFNQRSEVLSLTGDSKPDMASLTLGSMNFINDHSINSPATIVNLIKEMKNNGVKPELEIFEHGMIHYAKYLMSKNYLEERNYINILLGSLGTLPATPKHLVNLVEEIPEKFVWGATGIGQFAFNTQSLSIAMGGHVRVGIEDSIYMDKTKQELATNEKLVLRVKKVAEAMGREIATPGDVRNILELSS